MHVLLGETDFQRDDSVGLQSTRLGPSNGLSRAVLMNDKVSTARRSGSHQSKDGKKAKE